MNAQKKRKPPMGQAGMALVEFAVVVPLLTILLLGLIEIGRFMYFSIVVGNAARAGAEYAAFSITNARDTTGISTAATNDGQNNIKAITAQSSVVCACWNGTTGTESPAPPNSATCGTTCTNGGRSVTYVKVTTNGTYNAMFNYPGLPSTFTVGSTDIMRVHQ